MSLRNIFILIGVLLSGSALSQIPKDYYSSTDQTKELNLKATLTSIISKHTVLGYKSLWEYYPETYYHHDDKTRVFDMYSDIERHYDGSGSAVSVMNKEHTVPKSWWGGGSGCNGYSDLYNVIPSDANANSRKSNYSLGIVGKQSWTNGVSTIGTGTVNGKSASFFEPKDDYKGDFARIYFYMATCYPNAAWDSNSAVAMTNKSKKTLQDWIIPMLLTWHKNDPVDKIEIQRNDDIYKVQGNRNPFIDYPQLVEYIWGDKTNSTWYLAQETPTTSITDTPVTPVTPDNPDNPTDPDDPENLDTPITPDDPEVEGMLFAYTFDAIVEGNSNASSGSSVLWKGSDDISTSNVYEAGGSARLGSAKKVGSITTREFNSTSKILIEIDVKGWTSVENNGELSVSVSGVSESKVVKYTSKMSEDFQTIQATFTGVPAKTSVTISTIVANHRCFIDAIRIYEVKDEHPSNPDEPEGNPEVNPDEPGDNPDNPSEPQEPTNPDEPTEESISEPDVPLIASV